MKTLRNAWLLLLVIVLLDHSFAALAAEPPMVPVGAASASTAQMNEAVYALLDFADTQEFAFAQRGLITAPEALVIQDATGRAIWSQQAFAFVETDEAPSTVNPSLWRNAQLNHLYGLFEVCEGIYQVRGYDTTNLTLIAGDTGWIVFDPLTSVETAQAALALANEVLGERPVVAVVISHPHADHYGGIKGVLPQSQWANPTIPIIVPEGFQESAVSENVHAGNAMKRRATYQYGTYLPKGALASLGMGLASGIPAGTGSYLPPNDIIHETGEMRVIDGVTMTFQMTPGTEAPAEMNTWFPERKALWMAENCCGTLHNLYTLRGAQVRDGNLWAGYLMDSLTQYGAQVDVVFQAHQWPHWGNDVIHAYITNIAAIYKFINDQTLLYINQGYTADEISDRIQLPEALAKVWYTRPYYGTVAHNARAVYQKYMGWYDANPVHLNPLAPTQRARKFVEYLGDVSKVLAMARVDYENGEYRWVADITNLLVFADPGNLPARALCADALEQLGYQAESATWRNAYLTGAQELRSGVPAAPTSGVMGNPDILRSMTPEMIFQQLGIALDTDSASALNLRLNVVLQDGDQVQQYLVTVISGVLIYQIGVTSDAADATITLTHDALVSIMLKTPDSGSIQIEGDQTVLDRLLEHVVAFGIGFPIVEP